MFSPNGKKQDSYTVVLACVEFAALFIPEPRETDCKPATVNVIGKYKDNDER